MKKISFLATTLLIIGFAVFILVSETKAQLVSSNDSNSSSNAKNRSCYVKTNDRTEVAFTNKLTFDSLVYIKNDLKTRGIMLYYKKIEFDDKNQLVSIDGWVESKDGCKGGFGVGFLNSTNKNKRIGFFFDYSKNAKIPFQTGSLTD